MAKYLGIPLTVSNGNKVPITAQPELVDTTVTQSSDWFAAATSPSTASITSDGGLVNVVSGNFAYVRTSVNSLFTIGKSYTATVRFQRISGSGGSVGVRQTIGSPLVIKNLTGGIQEITYNFTAYVDDQLYILREGTGDYSFLVSYVSVKEIAATETPTYGSPELVTNGDFENDSDWVEPAAGWDILNGKANYDGTGAQFSKFYQVLDTVVGRKYKLTFTLSGISANSINFGFGSSGGNFIEPQESFSTNGTHTRIMVADRTDHSIVLQNNTATQTFSVDNVSVKEVQDNYLQVADGGFTKSVKEGDVVFNTSTGTEGVVKEVIDNNVLLMSNDNFSTADEFFNVFAANGDTRGNQLINTDNYIMSEYDENTSNPQESSFWFAGGKNSDKVVLTQLNPATNTFFVAGVIEEYLERLNSQSATDSRLDIPLDAFRDHQYNEILTTTAITLS